MALGNLASQLGLALHLGCVGVNPGRRRRWCCFFNGDFAVLIHLRAPCCACQTSKSRFAAFRRVLINPGPGFGVAGCRFLDFFWKRSARHRPSRRT